MRYLDYKSLPPAARGGAFCKNCPPWTPPQKLLIKGGHGLQRGRVFMQTMTAFGSFGIRRLKKRLKASVPLWALIVFVCNLYFVICNFFTYRSPMPCGPPEAMIGMCVFFRNMLK
jgi:hypothetical protein